MMAIYALSVSLLILNLFFITGATVSARGKNKSFINPEDKGYQDSTRENEAVARAMRAHRNALENMVPFFAIAMLYLMTSGSPLGAKVYFGVFVAARWLHSIVYLAGKQPWRTLTFAIGALSVLGMTAQVLLWSINSLMK
jgi:glutathione S-transferase